MKSLLDLSKELGLRAENLRAHLAERGIPVSSLDAPLDDDTETLLRESVGKKESWLGSVVNKWFSTREDPIDNLFNEAVGETSASSAPPLPSRPAPASNIRSADADGIQDIVQREPLDDIPELPSHDWFDPEDDAGPAVSEPENTESPEPELNTIESVIDAPQQEEELPAAAMVTPPPAEISPVVASSPAPVESRPLPETAKAAVPEPAPAPALLSDEISLDDLENISLSDLVQTQELAHANAAPSHDGDTIDLEAMLAVASKPPEHVGEPDPPEDVDIEAILGLNLEREPEAPAVDEHAQRSGVLGMLTSLGERFIPAPLRRFAVPLAVMVLGAALVGLVVLPQLNKAPAGGEEALLEQARLKLREANTDGARKDFERIVKSYPASLHAATAHIALGIMDQDQGRWTSAQRHFQEGVDRIAAEAKSRNAPLPHYAWDALVRIGRCLVRQEFYDQAVQHFENSLSLYPHANFRAREREKSALLGDLYYEWAQRKRTPEYLNNSNESYAAYLKDNPGAPLRVSVLYRMGRNNEALARAFQSRAEESWLEAVRNYNEAIAEGMSSPYGYGDLSPLKIPLALGGVYRALGEHVTETGGDAARAREYYDIARRTLEAVLKQNPGGEDEKRTRVDLAWCYLGLEDAEKAIDATRKILNDYRSDPAAQASAYYVQGDAYGLLNKRTDACEAYELALKNSPDAGPNNRYSQRAWMRLTNYKYFDKQLWDAAAANYEEIIKYGAGESGPYTMRAIFNLGLCYQNLGDFTKALVAFDRLVNHMEDFKPYDDREIVKSAFLQIGHTFYLANRFGECVAAHEEAFKKLGIGNWSRSEGSRYAKDDQVMNAFLETARASRRLESYPRAIENYRRLLQDFPQADADGAIALELASVLMKTFKYTDARDVYESLARKNPDNPAAVKESLLGLARSFEEEALSPRNSAEERQALLARAIKAYDDLRKVEGNDPRHVGRLGLLYRETGRYKESNNALIEYLKRATETGAALDPYRHAQGMNWLKLEDPAKAVKVFDQMTGNDRTQGGARRHSEALIESARWFLKSGDLTEAEKRFQLLVRNYASDAETDPVIRAWVDDARRNLDHIAWKQKTDKVLASS